MAPYNFQVPHDAEQEDFINTLSSSSSSPAPSEVNGIQSQHSLVIDDVTSNSSFSLSDVSSSEILTYAPIIIPLPKTLKELLVEAAKTEDLKEIKEIKLRVLGREVSLQRLYVFLPNLVVLNLEGSYIHSIRELGCNLVNLKVLRIIRCGLTNLDGTLGLSSLEELYAGQNTIDDVGPCAYLSNLKILDVRTNKIVDIHKIGFLALCTELEQLFLENNFITVIPDYRKIIKYFLPQLHSLDGVQFNENEISKTNIQQYVFDDSNSLKSTSSNCSSIGNTKNDNECEKEFSTLRPHSSVSVNNENVETFLGTSGIEEVFKKPVIKRNVLTLPPLKPINNSITRPSTSTGTECSQKTMNLKIQRPFSAQSESVVNCGELDHNITELQNLKYTKISLKPLTKVSNANVTSDMNTEDNKNNSNLNTKQDDLQL